MAAVAMARRPKSILMTTIRVINKPWASIPQSMLLPVCTVIAQIINTEVFMIQEMRFTLEASLRSSSDRTVNELFESCIPLSNIMQTLKRRHHELDSEPDSPEDKQPERVAVRWSPPVKKKGVKVKPEHTLFEHISNAADYINRRRPIKRTNACNITNFQAQRRRLDLPSANQENVPPPLVKAKSESATDEDVVSAAFVRKYFGSKLYVID
mmetsp:Transcript_28898/g.51556  ORF Transcript_28898/g.51556 Transcript_28898/m.51556 type:complete len:211 (-) Transcript_28898:490-1122(-)